MAEEETQAVGVRLPVSLIQRIDRQAERMSQPGVEVTRTGAVRALLLRALDQVEREQKAAGAARRGARRKG